MSYIVYTYQYNNMRRPRIDAQRRTFRDARDFDALPPTVLEWANVAATNKREAIGCARGIERIAASLKRKGSNAVVHSPND